VSSNPAHGIVESGINHHKPNHYQNLKINTNVFGFPETSFITFSKTQDANLHGNAKNNLLA